MIKHCIVSALVFLSAAVFAADSALEWKTFETDHFLIHHPDNLTHLVSEVAAESERAHQLLVPYMAWQPKDKTHVVMVDDYDSPNGSATPIPNNTMMLIMQPPVSGSLTDYDSWLRLLIIHEYTHILHMDKALEWPAQLRKVFGRFLFLFPNALHPNWFQEGFATFKETDDELGIGRGQSDTFQVMMRQEVLTGLKSLSQVNTVLGREWPRNHAYLYGVYYMRFIRDTYGEDALKQLIYDYSDNLIPFRVDSNPQGATGKNLRRLWPEFERYLQREFAPQIASIEQQGVTSTQVLYNQGVQFGSPRVDSQRAIWFTGTDGYNGAALYRFRQNETERLVSLNTMGDLDISAHDDIALTQLEVCEDKKLYFDIYKIPVSELYQDAPKLQRLTKCGRYHKVRWFKDGLVALRYEGALAQLHLLTADGQLSKVLWQGSAGDILGDFDVDALGHLVAVIKHQGQSWNLFKTTLADDHSLSSWTPLTNDDGIPSAPVIQNKQVYFVLAAQGQKEVHRLPLSAVGVQQPERLTNLLTGVEEVVPYGQRQMVLTEYTHEGPRISIAFKHQDLSALNVPASVQYAQAQQVVGDTQSYNPLPSASPTWWLPVLQSDGVTSEVGFLTQGNDAVGFHQYAAQVTYESTFGYLLPSIQYSYDGRVLVNYNATLSSLELGLSDINEAATYQRDMSLAYMHSIRSFARRWHPYVAYINSLSRVITDDGDMIKISVNGQQTYEVNDDWVATGFIYDSLQTDLYQGDYGSGSMLQLNIESASVAENDLSEGEVFTLDARHHLSFKQQRTLAQRFVLGLSDEGTPGFRLGGVFSDPFYMPTISLNKRNYALRGYKEGLAQLRGDNMALYSVEYRLPFKWNDRTIMIPPIGALGWSARAFAEAGSLWRDGESPDKAYPSLGAELIFDDTIGYYLPVRLRLGLAVGLDSELGSSVGYLEFGSAF